ncbi:MAG: hypothetical protein TU36_001390 [Vulcanisaeta sp. AZ3]
MSLSINELLRKLLEFTQMEVNSDELQRPLYESYAQLIQGIVNNLPTGNTSDKELLESMVNMVKETLTVLVRRRIEKIMGYYRAGKIIPQELLFMEEKRFLTPFLDLRIPEAVGVVLVSFRENFPMIRSVTGSTYGPFTQFDIAVLPRTDAEDLRRRGIVDVLR